jgi:hypothetical protein
VKIYTAAEIAGILKVSYKTVLNQIKRGRLQALPGLRHKRVTEEAFNRYLGVSNVPNGTDITSASAKPLCTSPATLPARPAVPVVITDKSPVSPAAKVVAPLSRSKPNGKK